MEQKTKILIGSQLASAILLSLGWFEFFSGLFLLIAFVPLLLAEDYAHKNHLKWGLKHYAYCFLLWNVMTTWWIYNATAIGAIVAFVGNSLQMCIVFGLWQWSKKWAKTRVSYAFLICSWLVWEWFYLDAEISWTWLALGNGLAKDVLFIQWYDLTGALGGSLWIWIVNLSVFFLIKKLFDGVQLNQLKPQLLACGLWILLPIGYSVYQYYTYTEIQKPCKALVLQPNIDPYTEKFGKLSYAQQVDIVLNLMQQKIDSSYSFIISPETAFPGAHWENDLLEDQDVNAVQNALSAYPDVSFVGGIESQLYYVNGIGKSKIARAMRNSPDYYDSYNTALLVNKNEVKTYHKSKLVVGVEMLPYHARLDFIGSLSINLGGTSGTLGTQIKREVFHSVDQQFAIGPAICFESVYGQHFSQFVQEGANIMAIITNDGWWLDTPGHRQHLRFASMRAIENRRSIFRSGNTGISALINQRGDIIERTKWAEQTCLSGTLNANSTFTIYTLYGDFIGRIAGLVWLLLMGYLVVARLKKSSKGII